MGPGVDQAPRVVCTTELLTVKSRCLPSRRRYVVAVCVVSVDENTRVPRTLLQGRLQAAACGVLTHRVVERLCACAETHLLKPSRSDPGEFTSVNGKKLSCVGSEMRCRKGFAEPVTARVLSSEEVKVATGDVSVLFLNRPLEGGIDAPGGVDDMDTATVRGFVAMLRSFPENQVAFQRLDKFIKTLHK